MTDLDKFRKQIDKLDDELVAILSKRIKLTELVRDYKAEHKMPGYSPERWAELKKIHQAKCQEAGVDYKLVEPIFDQIHKYVLENVHKDLN